MDRTVPTSGNEEINLYLRTYYSLLRSSREVQINTLANKDGGQRPPDSTAP